MAGRLSVLYPETRSVAAVRDLALDAEARGLNGLFLGSAFGFDSIMALASAGTTTSEVLLGVAVMPTYPRHPLVMAQQAATASQMSGGRFRLGLGPSHVPVMGMYGIDGRRPLTHLDEYLTVVQSLLETGTVDHTGEHYTVKAFLDVADAPKPPVMLAAMQPRMSQLAGRRADGALPWLAPARHVADVIVPNVGAGAAEAEREAPPVLAELPCVLTTDRDEVRKIAATDLGVYPFMPNYRQLWEAIGVELPPKGWSDSMIDASIVWGDEAEIDRRVRELLDAGAAEVVLSPFGTGDDPSTSRAQLVSVLADINRSIR